jgi:hypothetical protein
MGDIVTHFVVRYWGAPIAFYTTKTIADGCASALGDGAEVSEEDGPVPSNDELAGLGEETTGAHVPNLELVRPSCVRPVRTGT